ncbi:MAG: hypothetical protein K0Q81_381, partial [Paenibacillus sp.]|nr:hypothetical protein [Paenibacillus sp.]
MNLADMLCYADIQQLSSIANTYDCQCNGHSKNELIQSILSKVNRRDVFEQQLTKLSIEDIRFLNSIVFDKRDLFSLEELVARARLSNFATAVVGQPANQAADSWNPREMISKFKHSGWLFNGYSQQTRYLFQFPTDMKRRFTETLVKQFQSELNIMDEPSAYRDEQGLITEDIYHFLHYMYNQDVPITAEGFMYKRPLQQIIERMSVIEELPKGGWRFGYGRNFRDHPNRFSL